MHKKAREKKKHEFYNCEQSLQIALIPVQKIISVLHPFKSTCVGLLFAPSTFPTRYFAFRMYLDTNLEL